MRRTVMLFGHEYNVRAKVKLTDGTVGKLRFTFEVRLMDATEILTEVKSHIKREILFQTDKDVQEFLQLDIF